MKISLSKIIFFFWTFYILFLPPIIPVTPIIVIGVWSWIYIFLNYRRLSKNFYLKKLSVYYSLFVLLNMYLCIVSIASNGKIDQGLGLQIYLVIFGCPSAVAYCVYIDKHDFCLDDIIRTIIGAGVVQGIIAILSLISYSFQSFFIAKLYYIMDRRVVDYWKTMRLYGWATGMTYSMPILAATLGILAIIYSIKSRNKYFLYAPIIWMAGILNARTSLVVIFVGIICFAFMINYFNSKEVHRIKRIVLVIILFLVLVYVITYFGANESLNKWINNGVKEIFYLLNGQKTGYFVSVGGANNSLEFPPNLIFGIGRVGTRSDVGYIRDLWFGGLIYLIVLYGMFFLLNYKLFARIRKEDRRLGRSVFFFFFLTFGLVNIKGNIFSANEFMMFFLICVIILIFYKNSLLKTRMGEN